MTRYRRWTQGDGIFEPGIHEIWTELDEHGRVTREIGLNSSGVVVHQFPSVHDRHGTYGLFDGAVIEVLEPGQAPTSTDLTVILVEQRADGSNLLDHDAFEARWEHATAEAPSRRRPDLVDRLIHRLRAETRGGKRGR